MITETIHATGHLRTADPQPAIVLRATLGAPSLVGFIQVAGRRVVEGGPSGVQCTFMVSMKNRGTLVSDPVDASFQDFGTVSVVHGNGALLVLVSGRYHAVVDWTAEADLILIKTPKQP
jgi:hypothetical protein